MNITATVRDGEKKKDKLENRETIYRTERDFTGLVKS